MGLIDREVRFIYSYIYTSMQKRLKRFLKFFVSTELAIVLVSEIFISILISVGSLYLFLKISDGVLEREFYRVDTSVIYAVVNMRNPDLTSFMLQVTELGNPLILFAISAVTVIYLYTRRKKDAFIFSAILYCAVIVNIILKAIYAVPRPDYMPLVSEIYYSFPSGHAMNSFVFFLSITYFIYRSTRNLTLLVICSVISTVLVFLIGFSRIYLGVHFPSDIFAGYIAGVLWFVSAIALEKTVIFERLYKSSMRVKK